MSMDNNFEESVMKVGIAKQKVPKFVLTLWLAFNLIDTVLTLIIIKLGGQEIGLGYQLANQSMISAVTAKWLIVILIPLVLYRYNEMKHLKWFLLIAILPVIWNAVQVVLYG